MASGVRWFPPLPSNFEARWDPHQKAYFFINHNDKSTSWQDPRFAPASPKPPTQSQHAHGHSQSSTPQRHAETHAPGFSSAAAQLLNTNSHRQSHGASEAHTGQAVPLDTFITQYGSKTVAGGYAADEDSDSLEEDFDSLFQSAHKDSSHVDEANLRKLKQMFPNVPDKFILNALTKNHNTLSLTINDITAAGYTKHEEHEGASNLEQKHKSAVQRVRAVFPVVRWDIIQDVLAGCNYNEESARAQLIAFGYHPKTHDKTKRSPSPRPNRHDHHHHAAEHQEPELSDSDKTRLRNQVKSDFPSFEESVIEMALVSSNYDPEKARQVLRSWTASKSTTRPRASAATSGSTSTGSESPVKKFSGELAPVVFGMDDPPKSKHSSQSTSASSSTRSTPSHSVKSTPQRQTSPAPRDDRSHKTTHEHHRTEGTGHAHRRTEGSAHAQLRAEGSAHAQHRAEGSAHSHHRTEGSAHAHHKTGGTTHVQHQTERRAPGHHPRAKQVTHARKQVVMSQPQQYVSAYHTKPNGPDSSLRHGHNAELLLENYIESKGPNPSLRQGPDPHRVMGSQGAHGPDPSLHCGPQSGQHQNLNSPRRILVSNI